MIFDEVAFFKDTGFMEGGQDVPALPVMMGGGFVMNNLDISDAECTSYGVRCFNVAVQKDSAFSEMKVECNVDDAMKWTYLRATMTTNDGSSTYKRWIYGWVDSVEIITAHVYTDSYTAEGSVRVRWHIDYWRTYADTAVFGRGTVKRQHLHVQPQNYTCVQRIIDSDLSQSLIADDNKLGWCITVYNTESNDNTSNNLVVLCMPFMKEGNRMTMVLPANAGLGLTEKRGYSVTMTDIYTGKIGEIYGLAPSQIVSSWVCLTELFVSSKTGTDEYSFVDPSLHGHAFQKTYDNDVYIGLKFTLAGLNRIIWPGRSLVFTVDDGQGNQVPAYLGTTDYAEARVIAADGSTIEVLPKGFTFNTCRILIDVSATAAYYILRFNNVKSDYAEWTSYKVIDNEDSNAYGFECHIPMDPVPVAANSWSEYAFSADRQYDIESRVAQQEIAYTKNLLGVGTSALSGGVVGGMSGNPIGAAVGAIVGLVGGTVEAVGGKMTDEAWNGTLQDLEDRRAAGQHDGIALPGGGYLWWTSERRGMTLEIFAMDAVTQANIAASETINGYSCDVPAADCSSYFDVPMGQAYPLQIADLEVTGPIPNAARNYIRGRLAAGVRMVQTTRWS